MGDTPIKYVTAPGDIERELRRRIEVQAIMIAIALGYLRAGNPHAAHTVLAGVGADESSDAVTGAGDL